MRVNDLSAFPEVFEMFKNRIQSIKRLIDSTQQLKLKYFFSGGGGGGGFENGFSAIKMIKDKIKCRSQSLLNFRRTECSHVR